MLAFGLQCIFQTLGSLLFTFIYDYDIRRGSPLRNSHHFRHRLPRPPPAHQTHPTRLLQPILKPVGGGLLAQRYPCPVYFVDQPVSVLELCSVLISNSLDLCPAPTPPRLNWPSLRIISPASFSAAPRVRFSFGSKILLQELTSTCPYFPPKFDCTHQVGVRGSLNSDTSQRKPGKVSTARPKVSRISP